MCSEEFRLRNFKLTYPNGEDFATSPWFPLPVVIAYRLLIALYCWIWIVYTIVTPATITAKWLIYLTDWTFTCVASYFALATAASIIYYVHSWKVRKSEPNEPHPVRSNEESLASTSRGTMHRQSLDSHDALLEEEQETNTSHDQEAGLSQSDDPELANRSTPHFQRYGVHFTQAWYHKVLWVAYIIAVNNSPCVTVIYWTMLYTGGGISEADVAVHLLNSVFMVTDTCVSSVPVRIFHVVYAWLYGIMYLLFTVVYWLSGGTDVAGNKYIYPILNYESDATNAAIIVVAYASIGLPVSQLLIYGLFRLRCYISGLQRSR